MSMFYILKVCFPLIFINVSYFLLPFTLWDIFINIDKCIIKCSTSFFIFNKFFNINITNDIHLALNNKYFIIIDVHFPRMRNIVYDLLVV